MPRLVATRHFPGTPSKVRRILGGMLAHLVVLQVTWSRRFAIGFALRSFFFCAGEPFIVGTTMKIVEPVLGRIAHGRSPEELHFQYPHLSLGQIYSALAYYADHQDELDRDIERRLGREIRQFAGSSPLVKRLEREGKLVHISQALGF